jgi:hypothetical protein
VTNSVAYNNNYERKKFKSSLVQFADDLTFSFNDSIREPVSLNESGDTSGYIKYKALYDFDSRNPDELPFKAGDIIMVSLNKLGRLTE